MVKDEQPMAGKAARTRTPLPADRRVGSRIRIRRRSLNISQTRLGNALGITFQQIQKYENGTNRIGAGRLQQIADALECDVGWFFEDKGEAATGRSTASVLVDAELSAFYADRYAPSVVRHFARLAPPVKRALANVIAAAAEQADES
jgi:transcriptional regulator with XRE-family HTH domain